MKDDDADECSGSSEEDRPLDGSSRTRDSISSRDSCTSASSWPIILIINKFSKQKLTKKKKQKEEKDRGGMGVAGIAR